jgi:SAM-dependent methyltransferase
MPSGGTVTKVELNELPHWSEWPARVLGLTEWTTRARTRAKVEAEYDAEKYANCLAYLTDHPDATREDLRTFEFGPDDETICISRSGHLFSCTRAHARALYVDLLAETMGSAISASGAVVELGCGYGYNLGRLAERFPGPVYRGGDYSAKAVEIAGALYRDRDDVAVERFDFYETPYSLLDGLPEPLTVFTAHSLEQVPHAGTVLDALVALGGRIGWVFHFEPLHDLGDDSLLGLMRRRYDELNDYNRDLAQQLRGRDDVCVHRLEADALGLNPLHPVGIAHWEPA